MHQSQRSKFDLPENISYFNCTNISPLIKSLATLAYAVIEQRVRPYKIIRQDWFNPVEKLKKNFSRLISCNVHNRIAFIPSLPADEYLSHQSNEYIKLSTLVNNIEILASSMVEFGL